LFSANDTDVRKIVNNRNRSDIFAGIRENLSTLAGVQSVYIMLYKSKASGRNCITPNLRLHPNTSPDAFATFLKEKKK